MSWWQPRTVIGHACWWAESLHTRLTASSCPCLKLKELLGLHSGLQGLHHHYLHQH